MIRLVVLLLIIAGVAGYFTRPDEAKMRQAAEAALSGSNNPISAIGDAIVSGVGDRSYDNYYVASKYTIASAVGRPGVQCWGYFTQVSCSRVEQTDSGATTH
jgi:hypothetical protein